MGLLPLTLHLCCEEQRCHEAPSQAQASCCAGPQLHVESAESDCGQEAACCDDVAFFNLAPFFSWGESSLRLLPLAFDHVLPHQRCNIPEINASAQVQLGWFDRHHPPAESHLPVFLSCRRLLI